LVGARELHGDNRNTAVMGKSCGRGNPAVLGMKSTVM